MSGERRRARRENLLVVLTTGLFAAGLCFIPPTVFEGLGYVTYWRPTLHFLANTVRAGVIPLWNPYVGLGRPFLADMQNVVCYPPAYLICVGQEAGVFLLGWLHGLVAIWGMRRLGDALGTGRWQSYFMGFTYLASGELAARWMTAEISYCWGLCFVPWLLYYVLRTEEPWQSPRLAQYAGCLAMQFLCGFATARKGRDLALAGGRVQLAEWLLTLMEDYNARKPVRGRVKFAHESATRRAIYGAGVRDFRMPVSRSGLGESRSRRGYFSPS